MIVGRVSDDTPLPAWDGTDGMFGFVGGHTTIIEATAAAMRAVPRAGWEPAGPFLAEFQHARTEQHEESRRSLETMLTNEPGTWFRHVVLE